METSLEEVMRPVRGRRRRYLLYRIAEVDADTSRGLCGIKKATMNTWFKDDVFIDIHRQLQDLTKDFKRDAINMLRRDTQLAAVMLEADIIDKLAQEVKNGDYKLLRTPLAKEVYSKLISDLDVVKVPQVMSWEQNIANLIIDDGGTVEGEFEAAGSKEKEHSESNLLTTGE